MEKRTPKKLRCNRVAVDLERLARMGIADLRRMHREMFDRDHSMPNAEFLRRKIAWHAQAQAEGGLPESARQHAMAIARDVRLRTRGSSNVAGRLPAERTVTSTMAPTHDSRLPLPGSLLVKDFKGQTIVVRVLDDGFEYDRRRFSSLSAVAQAITGTKWNGFAFFGLIKEARRA